MKRWFFAVCLTLCLIAIGQAEERDSKTFYFAGGLKVTPVERTPHIVESLLNINICEFDVELPNAPATLQCVVAESGGLAKEFQDDPQGPLQEVYATTFFPTKVLATNERFQKAKLTVAFMPMREEQVSGDLFNAPNMKVVCIYKGAMNSQIVKNPLSGFNSSQFYATPRPDSLGSHGTIPKQRSDAIGIMRFFKTKMPNDKMVTYKDIFLKFTLTPDKS